MLIELKIRNLAIIEEVEIQFLRGLNVLTGETGAGKSILLEALNLILGGRSDRTLIRTGQDEAWVEGLFEMDEDLQSQLQEWGISAELEEPLSLRRVLQSNGRSRAYINCASAPASLLKKIAPLLVDFGRQHDQAILLNPENHLQLLDRFAEAHAEREEVEAAHKSLMGLIKERQKLEQTRAHRIDRMEFLCFQQEAILDVDPQPGEEKDIIKELQALEQREKQKELATLGEKMLYGEEDSVQGLLSSAITPIEKLAGMDEELGELVDELHEALVTVEETARTLRLHVKSLHLDEHRMSALQDRLDQIMKLQEKYGGDFDSVMDRLDEIEEELQQLEAQQSREKELGELIEDARDALGVVAVPLTQKRLAAAARISEAVQAELDELAMPGARFGLHFQALLKNEGELCPWDGDEEELAFPLALEEQEDEASQTELLEDDEEELPWVRIASWGAERGSFYLAANEGEELRPLERVASGGELSRILLALKRVLAGASTVQTFVFDEIDSGVAGAAATQVAKKLRQIASPESGAQILCISHTPQIAAEADAHLHVKKATTNSRTRTRVKLLDHQERVTEIARMLAGDQSMDQAVDLARQLLGSTSHAPFPEPVSEDEDISEEAHQKAA